MVNASIEDRAVLNGSEVLLEALAEELKLPLMHIVRSSELALMTQTFSANTLEDVRQNASTALTLVDSYLLGLELAEKQQSLELQPTSVNSVLYDVMHQLEGIAKQYDIRLELDVKHNKKLVMANSAGLKAAFLSLGYAFIEAQADDEDKSQVVKLLAHNNSETVTAGIYSKGKHISPKQFRAACQWYGKVRQPLNHLSATSAAGIFVAKKILNAMTVELRTSHHDRLSGLATNLYTNGQLQLI